MPCYDDRLHPRYYNSFSDGEIPQKPKSESDIRKSIKAETICKYQAVLEERARVLESTMWGQINWLEAALCLMTSEFSIAIEAAGYGGSRKIYQTIPVSFEEHLDRITEEQWKEAGIQAADLREWRRVHEEAKRAAALAKLTPEDREALGL